MTKVLALLALLITFASCGSPKAGEETAVRYSGKQRSNATTSSSTVPPVNRDPLIRKDSAPKSLDERIKQAIENSQRTYRELNTFKGRMFDDGISQSQFILCAGIRLQELKAKSLNLEMDSKEAVRFKESIRQLMSRQRFVLLREVMNSGDSSRRSVVVTIPSSANDRERSFEVMELRKTTYLTEEWWGELQFKPYQICFESLMKPLPAVSERARNAEIAELGRDIAEAIKRLDFYFGILPQVEIRISEMVTLETRLTRVLHDYSFDQTTATSEIISEVTRNEDSPRRAKAILQQAQAGLVAAKPNNQEIADVIRCFGPGS